MDLDEPVNERGARGLVDLDLVVHVGVVYGPGLLNFEHVLLDALTELRDMIHRIDGLPVDLRQRLEDKSLTSLMEHLDLLLDCDLGQLLGCSTLQALLLFDGAVHRELRLASLRRVLRLLEVEDLGPAPGAAVPVEVQGLDVTSQVLGLPRRKNGFVGSRWVHGAMLERLRATLGWHHHQWSVGLEGRILHVLRTGI